MGCCPQVEQNQQAIEKLIDDVQNIALPAQEVCNIQMPFTSNRSGWWQGWSPIYTANVARFIVTPWRLATQRTNNTGKAVDMLAGIHFGNHLIYSRRIRSYLWLEWRVLVAGTPVAAFTYQAYSYKDKRNDTTPDVIRPQLYEIEPKSGDEYARTNIPAGATVRVETQARLQAVGAQPSAYLRYIGGLRSRAKINFYPRAFVVGRV